MSAFEALQPAYSMAAFVVGILVGMTGVGGGSLMTPILILLFGIHPATAVGTDLLHAAVTKSAGSVVHGRNRTIEWRLVRRLAAGSVPTTIATIAALSVIGIDGPRAGELINAVLALALIVTAMTLVFRNRLIERYSPLCGELDDRKIAAITVAVGAAIGVVVSISSVGAGAIGVTALVLLYPKLPAARIVGSDIAHAVPLTLVAGIGHWFLGSVDFTIFASLIVGSVPGILLGSYAALRVPDRALRLVLAVTLLAVATKLSFGLVQPPSDVVAVKASTPR
jgi:uncharacterized protein